MNTRNTLLTLMGVFTLLAVVGAAALLVLASNPRAEGRQDGQPTHPVALDLTKRYDIYCRFTDGGRPAPEGIGADERFFPSMRFIGYLNDPLGGAGASSRRGGHGALDNWTVLEYTDGRRLYLPPGSIRYFEETPTPTEAPPP